MKISEAQYSIGEIVQWYKRKELVVNREYQRGGGLWPTAAKSYFIDTILKDFPFPKVFFYEQFDLKHKALRREIVDGQQRVTTIVEFVEGDFALGKNARGFEGMRFADLTDDQQTSFLHYTVAVDVIRNADRAEILQMFRRMNAFTLPLTAAEKRHSEYFGSFKDWINTVLDAHGTYLVDWGVFTSKQVVRFSDAEFIADFALALERGIVSTTPARLNDLYKRHDAAFPERESFNEKVVSTIAFLTTNLSAVRQTEFRKPHMLHSLLCGLAHNRFGLPGSADELQYEPIGAFAAVPDEVAVANLSKLAAAYEEADLYEYPEFVEAAREGGNRVTQRLARVHWIVRALRGEL